MENQDKEVYLSFPKVLLILFFTVLWSFSTSAPKLLHAQTAEVSQPLQKAIEAYRAADFESAIAMLAPLVDDSTLTKDDKKEVYRILGLSYTAKGMYVKAKDVISELIKLEPPLVELDPDREPPKMMKIYYEVRKDITGSYLVERPDPGMKTVAILDFKNRSIDDKEKFDPLEKGFSDLVCADAVCLQIPGAEAATRQGRVQRAL